MKLIAALLVALVATGCGSVATDGGPAEPSAPLRFALEDEYRAGETVDVRLANDGDAAYVYNTEYAACRLHYRDESGRTFIIPPGTHCDLVVMAPIRPGETKLLFRWALDECVEDNWGCQKAKALPPGTYTISGSFGREGGGPPARAEATFRIVDA